MAEHFKLSSISTVGADVFPLADDFPLMFQISDLDGNIIRASDMWIEALGYDREEIVQRKSAKPLRDAFAQRTKPLMVRLIAQGQVTNLRHDFPKKNGDMLACVLSGTVLQSAQGQRLGAVTVINLVEGREPIVDALRRKSFRLQSCLEGTNAGTWEWNVQTGETIFNERWAEIVGYSLAELEPISIDTWLSLAHPDDLGGSEKALQKHWAGKSDFYDFEARMRHKDGHWIWVHDRGRVFTWTETGEPEWMFGTHVSLEERRREIAESENMKRLLDRTGEVAGVGGWEIDLATNEVTWTKETRRIHGVDDSFVPTIEQGISFYAPEARETITKAVETAMQNGSPWDLELPFVQMSGERIWVRAVGEVVFQNHEPVRIFGTFQNITDRVRQTEDLQAAVAALEESNLELDQFAYVASHDLKAPLRVIANATRWIEEDLGELISGDIQKSMNLVQSRVRRMDKLLTDLLEHSRIGRTDEDTALVTCAAMINEIRDLVDLRGDLRIETGPGLDQVLLPRFPATKILLNLVGNAIKHHDQRNGFVRIEATAEQDRVTLKVLDDGPGIPADMQERAFGLFQTLRPRDQIEGSGMGLAIVEKAVKTAGGRIDLISDGRGCEFIVELPCEGAARAVVRAAQ